MFLACTMYSATNYQSKFRSLCTQTVEFYVLITCLFLFLFCVCLFVCLLPYSGLFVCMFI